MTAQADDISIDYLITIEWTDDEGPGRETCQGNCTLSASTRRGDFVRWLVQTARTECGVPADSQVAVTALDYGPPGMGG
jgi:hypothetical protein